MLRPWKNLSCHLPLLPKRSLIASLNLKSFWLCLQQEIRQILAEEPRGGAIVNTSSVNGLCGVPQWALYAAAEAGLIALTKSAALEYAHQDVRINALA